MGRLILRDPAFEDINEIADFIAADNIDAAGRWYDAVERAVKQLTDMPGMGASREFQTKKLRDLKSWPITGFENYLVIYRPIPGGIDVLRIMHGARDLESILARTLS